MKALFAHDHYFYHDGMGNYFSSGKLPYTVWERYLEVFDCIHVVCRKKELQSNDSILPKLNKSSGPNVTFHPVPSLSSPLGKLVNHRIVKNTFDEIMQDVDVIIARLPSEIGSMAVTMAKKKKIPWAVEVVACAWDGLWNYGNIQGKLYAPFAALKTKRLIKQSSYALYVTNHFLQKRYPSKGYTAACSNVELPYIKDNVDNDGTIISNNLVPVIGVIASLSGYHKGLDTALKALNEVDSRGYDFKFKILGDGPRDVWKNKSEMIGIESKVEFCGTLASGEEVLEWLDHIDIYIQPSNQEGLPRAVIEAMSRARPVVGSTAGGIPELIDPACLHRPKDHHKLAELIIKMLNDRDFRCHQAKVNHLKSKKYIKSNLDRVRSEFWMEFKQYAKKQIEGR